MTMTDAFVDDIQQFYLLHRDELYSYALAMTRCPSSAEDALHNAFAGVLHRGRIPRELRPYIFRCVRNAVLDLRRASERQTRLQPLFEQDSLIDNPPSGLHPHEAEELLKAVLTPDEHETIVLKIYAGLTFREIAETRGISVDTIASWYRRGLARIKSRLEGGSVLSSEQTID